MDWILNLIMQWAGGFTVWDPTAAQVAQTLAVLATITTVVQVVKKAFEWVEAQAWLPQGVRDIFAKVAHGWGPVVLAALASLAAWPDPRSRFRGTRRW